MGKIVRALVVVAAVWSAAVSLRADFHVAPHARGAGNGASAQDAADYLDLAFWDQTVKPGLTAGAQTVWFADGVYDRGRLKLTAFGHPLNRCTLRAVTPGKVTWSAPASEQSILWLYGCQNLALQGIRFTGAPRQSALNLSWSERILKSGTRNIVVDGCWFENLTNLAYGAITFGANHDVKIIGCHFTNVTGPSPKHVHALYAGHRSLGIEVRDCDFTDIGGEYVRFRDDTDYALVDGCTFHSTGEAWNSPFIALALYNSRPPHADEFFGTHYQFSNNVFRYDAPNPAPIANAYCFAHYLYNSGHNVAPGEGLDYMLDAADAATLDHGTVAAKEHLLQARMGLTSTQLNVINPEYHGVVRATAYRGYGVANRGYEKPVDLSDWPGRAGTLAPLPFVRNGAFEAGGNRLRGWYVFAGDAPVGHPGLNGTSRAVRLAAASATEFGQWTHATDPRQVTVHCLFAVGRSAGAGVKFQAHLYHDEIANAYLAFAVDDAGRCGYLDGTTFVAVPELGRIEFSEDANHDGDYTGAGDTLRWYQLRIQVNYAAATPRYSLALGAANRAGDSTRVKGGLTGWVGGTPPAGSKMGLLNFSNSAADVIVDEVW